MKIHHTQKYIVTDGRTIEHKFVSWCFPYNYLFYFSAYGSITVVKGCGLRPCNPEAPLTPEEQREYDECQEFQFRDSYTCRVCCQHNSCNTATAISSIKSHYHNLILVTISLLFFFHYR